MYIITAGQSLIQRSGPAIQEGISPLAGPSQSIRAPITEHWNLPSRDRAVASDTGPIHRQEPVLTVSFDNIAATSAEPLRRGNQPSDAPTILANGSTRATKSRRSRVTKK